MKNPPEPLVFIHNDCIVDAIEYILRAARSQPTPTVFQEDDIMTPHFGRVHKITVNWIGARVTIRSKSPFLLHGENMLCPLKITKAVYSIVASSRTKRYDRTTDTMAVAPPEEADNIRHQADLILAYQMPNHLPHSPAVIAEMPSPFSEGQVSYLDGQFEKKISCSGNLLEKLASSTPQAIITAARDNETQPYCRMTIDTCRTVSIYEKPDPITLMAAISKMT